MQISKFEKKHLKEVFEIEQNSFSIPWSKKSIEEDVFNNERSIYIVALENGEVTGYAGMWDIVGEAHITNIAVAENHRQKGVGYGLVERLIQIATDKKMTGLTLEVRINNQKAQKLYIKHGFKIEGLRKNYYKDTNEDAVIMWKHL